METLKKTFVLFLFLGTIFSFAQSDSILLETDKSVIGFNEKIISMQVKIHNKTNLNQQLKLSYSADEGMQILSSNSSLKLAPNEKAFIPFKAFIGKTQPAGNSYITFFLTGPEGQLIATNKTQLTVEPKRQLRIIANQPQLLMEKIGDSLKISTQVYNGGNQVELVDIFATFPQNFGGESNLKKSIELKPFSNQEVIFSKIIDKELLKLELFTINIAGTDSNKEYFGNTLVVVQNALGNRKYVDPNNGYQNLNPSTTNHISWSVNNPFSKQSSTQNINLHSEFNIGNTKTSVNLNGTYWDRSDVDLQFQNTWVKVENRLFGLQVGNLNTSNLDINVNGRGAEFSYSSISKNKIKINTGIIEKSYNLFDPIHLEYTPRGYAAYANASINFNEKIKTDHQLIYDVDPSYKSYIFKNSYNYNNQKNTFYNIDIGYGYTQSNSDSQSTEPSVALGFNYRKNWKEYVFSSNNYYSSSYYPGIKKGNTVFEERISRSFKKFSIYLGYNLNIYNPKNLDPLYQYNSYSRRNKMEMGTSFSLAKGLTSNISWQWLNENSIRSNTNSLQLNPINFRSTILYSSLNYNTPNNKDKFNLTQSHGISYYFNLTKPQYIYQIQGNWYHGNLMFSSSYQYGNFMLYEGNPNGNIVNNNTERTSILINYRLALLSKKLNANLSFIGNHDTQYGKNYSFNTNFDYRIFRNTKIFADFNYNKYINSAFNNENIYFQFGIKQDLPTFGEETTKFKSSNLKIFMFYDLNNNNVFEPSIDRSASNVKIKINNTIFVSDEKGDINYRKIPYNEYLIKSLENHWYTDDQKIKVNQKEVFITMPLEKTSMIKGKVEYQEATKTQYEVPKILTGIPIIFKNKLNKVFVFYTNSSGEFTAYLPLGSYQISLDNNILPKNIFIDDNIQNSFSEEGIVNTLKTFILKIKEKKVEVKKFGTSQ